MKRWIRSALVGLVALAPAAALAAIDNTHHDMVRYTGAKERCAYCHARQLAAGTPPAATYGQVGNFCIVVCHDATIVTGAAVAGPGYYLDTSYALTAGASGATVVAFSSSHGRDTTVLTALGDLTASVAATGWPHSSKANMECTTCHTVHDATNPPFLNGQLGTGNNATAFCQKCHTGATHTGAGRAGRYQDITSMGAHPTEFALLLGTVARTAPKLGRQIIFKSPIFNRTVADTTVDVFNNTVGSNWPTGGHLFDTTRRLPSNNVATPTGVFGCYTCHSAHQTFNVGGIEQTGNMLLLANPRAATHAQSPLCAGCHGVSAGNGVNNPGTTAYYHPVNSEAQSPFQHDHNTHAAGPNLPNTGSFPIAMSAAWTGASAAFKGVSGAVVCASCHDVHGGVASLMAIRALGTTSPTNAQCLFCHQDSTGTQTGVNWHHPGGTGNYSTTHSMPASTAWLTIDGLGRLTDGLSCPDCHVFQGNATRRATAHNW